MVAGEQRPFFLQRETQMVRCVAGGVNGAQGPAGAARRVAVAHLAVGDEIEIAAFLDRDSAVGAVGAVAQVGAPVSARSRSAAGEWSRWV